MKSVKYKFSSDSTADCVAQHYLLELYFLRIFFQDSHRINEIYNIFSICSCRQFCPRSGILYDCNSSKNSLHMQTERECLRTKIPSTTSFKIRSKKSTPSESPKLRTTANPEISKPKLSVLLCESSQ